LLSEIAIIAILPPLIAEDISNSRTPRRRKFAREPSGDWLLLFDSILFCVTGNRSKKLRIGKLLGESVSCSIILGYLRQIRQNDGILRLANNPTNCPRRLISDHLA